jgi:hypothetical protein
MEGSGSKVKAVILEVVENQLRDNENNMNWIKKLFGKASDPKDDIYALIKRSKRDFSQHEDVGTPATMEQVSTFEQKTGFSLPPSFRIFVEQFGNGAYWLYKSQPLDSINNPVWLRELYPELPVTVLIDEGGKANRDALLCLMTEDSNGGSWCWITDESSSGADCPIAYFSFGKLYYKLPSFEEWLKILVSTKMEVIRALDYDKADKLGLG